MGVGGGVGVGVCLSVDAQWGDVPLHGDLDRVFGVQQSVHLHKTKEKSLVLLNLPWPSSSLS